jgi:EAL domain-containing protein (putative c-di-GMP-specific phosphodiesterase class I)
VEALVRWQHPQRGLLLPGEFLPLIEGDPMMIAMGRWVMNTAVAQLLQWRREGLELPVSVNLDATELQDPGFIGHLHDVLARHPELRPGDLELEILETAALADVGAVASIIRTCEQWGVHFCLDDFGTGYSSLAYLRTLPVKVLKIDQSFVRDMFGRNDDMGILRGVLGMAEAFALETVAEGVETAEQAEVLQRLGCAFAQGFGIARPMEALAVRPWLQHWMSLPGLDVATRIRSKSSVAAAADQLA